MGVNNLNIVNAAYSALQTAQAGLNVTSQNVAGASVEGFSRRKSNTIVSVFAPNSRAFDSTAFLVEGFTRYSDQLLTKQILEQNGRSSYTATLTKQVAGLDALMMDPANSIETALSAFFNAAGTLATDDQSLTNIQSFAASAQRLAGRITGFNEVIDRLKNSVSQDMQGALEKANTLAPALAKINERILSSYSTGNVTASADLLDERDRLANELQGLLGGYTQFNDDGTASFQVGGIFIVERGKANKFTQTNVSASPYVVRVTSSEGADLGAMSTKYNDTNVESKWSAGQVAADYKLLTELIPTMKAQLSALTVSLYRDANSVQKASGTSITTKIFDFKNVTVPSLTEIVGLSVSEIMNRADPTASGYDADIALILKTLDPGAFFTPLSTGPDAKTGFDINAVAANNIQAIRSNSSMGYAAGLTSILNNVSTTVATWKNEDQANQVVQSQLKSQRESISGVSLDEEAANMLKYQQLYGAASKLLQTANQMFNTLLSMMSA